jgi:hypothetical protein
MVLSFVSYTYTYQGLNGGALTLLPAEGIAYKFLSPALKDKNSRSGDLVMLTLVCWYPS